MGLDTNLRRLAGAMLACGVASAASAAPDPVIAGWWIDQSSRAGIEIGACDGDQSKICGTIAWLREPLTETGAVKTDLRNGDKALRSRPLCGLRILGNFVADGKGGWDGGWIYDPEGGATYKSVLKVADDGTLHVRGYIGLPLFGRTEVWRRPPGTLEHCTVTAAVGTDAPPAGN